MPPKMPADAFAESPPDILPMAPSRRHAAEIFSDAEPLTLRFRSTYCLRLPAAASSSFSSYYSSSPDLYCYADI
jgi:hypothetical protein